MNAKNTFAARLNVAALGLALFATLATMGSLQQLASTESSAASATPMDMASSTVQPAAQQVVIVGKRATRA